jgi:ABC-type transport system substrate-binding protein
LLSFRRSAALNESVSRRRAVLLSALALFGAAAALSAASGCNNGGDGGGGTNGGGGGDGQTASSHPGVLRYALSAEPTTFDPALVQDGPTIDMLHQVYEGLVGWNEKSEVVPLAAKEMPKVSADGKIYTFVLRDGLKFHNGRAVTADDVKYSITRALDPDLASPVAMSYLDDIVGAKEFNTGKAKDVSGVKVMDPKTVQVSIVAPRPYFLGKFTYGTAYIVPKEEVEKGPTTAQGAHMLDAKANNAVGTGPFKIASYVPGGKVVLDANPDYWAGKPKLTQIERPIVLDTNTARNLYESGELDIIIEEKGDYVQDKDDPALKDQIKLWPRGATWYLGLNQKAYAPFKDKRVRQAVYQAIDKDAIIKDVLLGVNRRAEQVVPEGIFSYDAAFKGLPYDPEKSKQLLAQAGFPGGQGLPPLTIYFREQQPDIRKTAEVLQQQLAGVGIPVELKAMEWLAFLNMNERSEQPAFHMRWSADYPDPQNFLSLLLSTTGTENHTGYSNPQFDALCAKADAEMDQAKRTALYRQAEKIAAEDAPWVPLYYQKDMELVKPYVSGIRDSLFGHLPHITTEVK